MRNVTSHYASPAVLLDCRGLSVGEEIREKEEKIRRNTEIVFHGRSRVGESPPARMGKAFLGTASPGCSAAPKCSDSIPRAGNDFTQGQDPAEAGSHHTPNAEKPPLPAGTSPAFPSPDLLLSLLPWCFPPAPVPASWDDSGPSLCAQSWRCGRAIPGLGQD